MIENRKAYYDYTILEEIECGMILESWEVKAVAANRCALVGAFCRFIAGRLYLTGATMGSSTVEQDHLRPRELLLKKKQLAYLSGKVREKNLTIVPLKVYTKHNKFKLLVGLAQGKKKHDKRDASRKTAIENDNRRTIKSQKLGV